MSVIYWLEIIIEVWYYRTDVFINPFEGFLATAVVLK